MKQKRLRDFGIEIGELEPGELNAITDVKSVTVGHSTIAEGDVQTGVTAILPHSGNIFKEKLIAATHVINGFGKTIGTIQVDELGVIETPILLTNTLSVSTAADELINYMLEHNPEIGRTTGTVNPVVGECNDMVLNDIRKKAVTNEHVREAIDNASDEFLEGAVGAGRGMVCYSLKGGIGSSSRRMELYDETYTLGVLVLSNFGQIKDLTIAGRAVGQELKDKVSEANDKDKGSIMIIVATDLHVSDRQLKRIIKRSVTGMARTGSIISHGSGDIVIGFSTATTIPHQKPDKPLSIPTLHEEDLDIAFRAVGEATEEAILNSLITANTVTGRDGHMRKGLVELLEESGISL